MSFGAIVSLLTLIGPLVLEIIKLFSGAPKDEHTALKKQILDYIRKVQAASKKAQETEGDTSEFEKIVNQPRP